MDGANMGIITLLPVVAFLVFALLTKKCISALIMSGVIGYVIYYKAGFIQPTLDALIDATTDWDNNWIVVICLLFGCLVQLLRESKGALAIGQLARKYVKSQKQVMLLTWLCGIIIFVDDYLSILVTANTILPVADEKKTPREMLCYIINTTSAPVCVIIPVSAWVVYFSGIPASPSLACLPVRHLRTPGDPRHSSQTGRDQKGISACRRNGNALARVQQYDEYRAARRGYGRHCRYKRQGREGDQTTPLGVCSSNDSGHSHNPVEGRDTVVETPRESGVSNDCAGPLA